MGRQPEEARGRESGDEGQMGAAEDAEGFELEPSDVLAGDSKALKAPSRH